MSSTSNTGSTSNEYNSEKNFISYTDLTADLKKKRPKYARLDGNIDSAVVWFKSDLRILDNPALYFASKFCQEKMKDDPNLIGLFVFCKNEMKIHQYSDCKIVLMLKAIESLKEELLNRFNVPLMVINIDDPLDVPQSVVKFCVQVGAKALFFNKQYERDERIRDEIVVNELKKYEIQFASYHDQCVIPPGTCKTKQGRDFVVFTPFKNIWLAALETGDEDYLNVLDIKDLKFQNGDHESTTSLEVIENLQDPIADLEANCAGVFSDENNWLTKEDDVLDSAEEFILKRANNYHVDRDFPSINGTSKISPYLALGMISAKYLVARCRDVNHGKLSTGAKGIIIWISEICWRDFYRNILVCFPYVCLNKPFKRETEAVKWNEDEEIFQKWCQGKTGYPIVDAAMRQLNETGWMHNRLRMVAAMFLTKDLLINWRWGEKYFMENLIDGDFASNNGGWQWSASTGTDSQPYFRIFNPLLQSQKFDSKGEFIKKWVPELAGVKSSKAIHDPYNELKESEFKKLGYPKPIVDHAQARDRAINAFKVLYGKK